jgi:hypothetical protein
MFSSSQFGGRKNIEDFIYCNFLSTPNRLKKNVRLPSNAASFTTWRAIVKQWGVYISMFFNS